MKFAICVPLIICMVKRNFISHKYYYIVPLFSLFKVGSYNEMAFNAPAPYNSPREKVKPIQLFFFIRETRFPIKILLLTESLVSKTRSSYYR